MPTVQWGKKFDRELNKVPAAIRDWALGHIDNARNTPLETFLREAEKMKGGGFRNCHVLKWRRKKPHGEHRLVFMAEEGRDAVTFLKLGPREDDYKTAARRARAMRGPAGD